MVLQKIHASLLPSLKAANLVLVILVNLVLVNLASLANLARGLNLNLYHHLTSLSTSLKMALFIFSIRILRSV
jgi:hypothetical protein